MNDQCKKTALAMLEHGLVPVAIRSRSKRPIANAWSTAYRTKEAVENVYAAHPTAGLGVLLGDVGDGDGVVDFEVDDPRKAEKVIRRIFGDRPTPTLHYHSNRGTHYLYRYSPRLLWLGASVIKEDHYDGVELRIGTTDPTRPVSLQSIIPPTPRDGGEPRQFYGPDGGLVSPVEAIRYWRELIAPIPDRLVEDAERFAAGFVDDESGHPQWSADDVKSAILSKGRDAVISLAKQWGLDVTGRESKGWIECRAIGREDKNPSAQFDPSTGVYHDFGANRTLSLLSLAVELGVFPGFAQAVNGIGKSLGVAPQRRVRVSEPPALQTGHSLDPWCPPADVLPVEVPPYPTEVFPSPLRSFIQSSSEAVDCPADYLGVSMVAVAGAAIGNSIHLRVTESYTQPPHLYAAFIGPPGNRKSSAVNVVSRPLMGIDAERRREYLALMEDNEGQETPTLYQHLVGGDSTKEAIAQFLSDNPRGGGMALDEIASLVSNLNAYRGGRGDDRQFFLSVNSGATIKVNRKGSPVPLLIRNPCLSIWGPLTPSKLSHLKAGDEDDGWFDRFVLSYPPTPVLSEAWIEKSISSDIYASWERTIRRIAKHGRETPEGEFDTQFATLSEGASHVYGEWFASTRREMNADPRVRGPWSKLEGYAFRFALILSVLDIASRSKFEGSDFSSLVVDTDSMERACALAEYHKQHARKVHQELIDTVAGSDERGKRILRTIARGIDDVENGRETALSRYLGTQEHPHRVINYRLIKTYHRWPRVDLEGAIEWLHQSGYLQTVENKGGRVGRPSSVKYAINPLWDWREHRE